MGGAYMQKFKNKTKLLSAVFSLLAIASLFCATAFAAVQDPAKDSAGGGYAASGQMENTGIFTSEPQPGYVMWIPI